MDWFEKGNVFLVVFKGFIMVMFCYEIRIKMNLYHYSFSSKE